MPGGSESVGAPSVCDGGITASAGRVGFAGRNSPMATPLIRCCSMASWLVSVALAASLVRRSRSLCASSSSTAFIALIVGPIASFAFASSSCSCWPFISLCRTAVCSETMVA